MSKKGQQNRKGQPPQEEEKQPKKKPQPVEEEEAPKPKKVVDDSATKKGAKGTQEEKQPKKKPQPVEEEEAPKPKPVTEEQALAKRLANYRYTDRNKYTQPSDQAKYRDPLFHYRDVRVIKAILELGLARCPYCGDQLMMRNCSLDRENNRWGHKTRNVLLCCSDDNCLRNDRHTVFEFIKERRRHPDELWMYYQGVLDDWELELSPQLLQDVRLSLIAKSYKQLYAHLILMLGRESHLAHYNQETLVLLVGDRLHSTIKSMAIESREYGETKKDACKNFWKKIKADALRVIQEELEQWAQE